MAEGNVKGVEVEAAVTPEPEPVAEKPEPIDVPAGQAVHFPTPKAVLTAGGQKVFQALRPQR
jgi:hypothetical protein